MAQFSERQKEIINESLKLIAKTGVQSLTIKNLSKAVKISEPAIYRHFTDKTDLLMSIMTYLTISEKWILKKVRASGPSALDRIESFFTEHFRHIASERNSSVIRCYETMFQHNSKVTKKIISMTNLPKDMLNEFILKGQKAGEIRSDLAIDQIYMMIMGAFRLLITNWQLANYTFDIEVEGKRLAESVKKMISA